MAVEGHVGGQCKEDEYGFNLSAIAISWITVI